MEGETDRTDREGPRFRLDWPEDQRGASDAGLSDFSFDWEQPAPDRITPAVRPEMVVGDAALAAAGEPQDDGFTAPRRAVPDIADVADIADVPDIADPIDIVPLETDVYYDAASYDSNQGLDSVRLVLNDHSDALVQLSNAVYELASNVGLLLDEIRATPMTGGGDPGGVTASAMVTMTSTIELLTENLQATRADLQGMMDDVVAAAGGQTAGAKSTDARVIVEIERLHSELQALKRRLPVRARELSSEEIADRVTDAVLAAIEGALPKARPATARSRPVAPAPA
ncbi:MAG: hypothetical protein H0W70_12435, partial [Actinobacteria bacterium]|nr:hypothetical protein [Actinomycetota bacterium]